MILEKIKTSLITEINPKINKFGKNKKNFNKFLILKNFTRQALHAYHVGFIHPVTKKYLEFESKFPEDLRNLLDLLVKY